MTFVETKLFAMKKTIEMIFAEATSFTEKSMIICFDQFFFWYKVCSDLSFDMIYC